MEKNKVTTYLLYAIGEIALVVIGILIAVQIDDWNEQRVNNKTLEGLLNNLIAEQELNLKYLKASKEDGDLGINSGLAILNAIKTDKVLDGRTTDSLVFRLIATNVTVISQGAMLDIISTGKIDLITNDTLRYLLLSFGGKMEDLSETQRLNNELLNYTAIPYLYDHFAFTKMDSRYNRFAVDWPKGRFESDLGFIFNDRKFENVIDDLVFRGLTVNQRIEQLSKDIQTAYEITVRELQKMK